MAHLAILVDLGGQPNKNFLRTYASTYQLSTPTQS